MEEANDVLVLANYIGGELVEPKNGKYLDSYNPALGTVHCKVPDSDQNDIQAAVEAAQGALAGWGATEPVERAKIMDRVADLIEKNLDSLARDESQDQGKPVWLAKFVDIPRAAANFRFFASAIKQHEERSTRIEGAINYTVREPVGIAGLISPWNLPLYLLTWKIAPAMCVGNCVIAKPSELTSVTAFRLAKLMSEAGVPKGVVNIVFGSGASAGDALVRHPNVPLISFTGGTVTAEKIIVASAPLFKKTAFELGGKNPNIIFEDADLDECIATTLKSSFANQGEICLCGSRIFVQKSIYDEFLQRFVEATKNLVVGDPTDPKTNLGALISKEHLAKVSSYIDLAKEEGGEVLCGGERPNFEGTKFEKGYFYKPTIITGLDPYCRTNQEEIFGPVVTVTPFETEDEVIEWANSVRYGLSATVWSENGKRANRIALALRAGTVWVNCWLKRDLRVPFGGMKHSGVGREGGEHSINFYSECKTVCLAL
eukprot:CAMPEP_0174261282 /NCGR_PEP_ID=MMETSP0439-20130205/11338_1 /TAXON_ID=0 /ORGANISM="Stereomyxa ramosa, Strain Chinc5" /LENGTH=486 /DNA_ID=CAMNT_0015345735 /DNA_START=21 /DNA_END=1481 /DNA_ORIENTATION=+